MGRVAKVGGIHGDTVCESKTWGCEAGNEGVVWGVGGYGGREDWKKIGRGF